MNRNLIALFGKNIAGWETLLQQEGMAYIVDPANLSETAYSVAVASDDTDVNKSSLIISYVKSGGSLLCSAALFGRLTGEKTKNEYVHYLMPEREKLFSTFWMIDVEKKCTILKDSNYLRTQNGTNALFLGSYSGGHVAALPFDCGSLVNDIRFTSKSFVSEKFRFPHEVVSMVSKGTVRQLFCRCLELLHHKRGLPYVHTWYYPQNEEVPFILRIDTDYASAEEVERLYRFIEESGINATWFVDVKSQKDCLNIFKNMIGHEISLHCYEHQPYETYELVDANIRRGISALREQDIVPAGYASPYGKWNNEIARAIIDNGFEYSSEFSYDYDNMPSFPWLGSGFSNVLQIPVHPVSVGTLRRQGYDENSMKNYFKMIIERHFAERVPVILYHHPKDGNEEVLKFVFSFVKGNNLRLMTMIDFARSWKKRIQSGFESVMEDFNLKIEPKNQNDEFQLHVVRKDGLESFVPAAAYIDLNKLVWNQPPKQTDLPANIARSRKFNPWIFINRIEDALRRKIL